ncbi:hypothetical protein [Achromobacter piechaudii]
MDDPTRLDRIKAKLDTLIEALADEGNGMEQLERKLDDEPVGGARDDS